jgi:acetyl-CoA carboxylase biotin carboxyl carrier protein
VAINFTELKELLGVISQSNITEFSLKNGDFEVSVRKDTIASGATMVPSAIVSAAPMVTSPITTTAPAETVAPTPADQKWTAIVSPMVGTFYRAPAPDEPAFVEVGDSVSKGQGVCIIEAMKLMNEIEAEVAGQVMEIAVENGEPVEYGQTLMWIKP